MGKNNTETVNKRFAVSAEKRVNKALADIAAIGNIPFPSTEAARVKINTALAAAIDDAVAHMETNSKTGGGFKL